MTGRVAGASAGRASEQRATTVPPPYPSDGPGSRVRTAQRPGRGAGNVDYDRTDLAAVYDRGRSHGSEVLDLWMDEVASHVRGQRVLKIPDLGCGTGRFSDALAQCFEADLVGVDPSKKMLAEAQRKPHSRRVRYARGRGEAIPLADQCADLVFMSMVFHHFDDPRLVARECY